MIESAGVIITKKNENSENVFLLLKSYEFWDFPKGGLENGENKYEAAIREVQEETGINDLNFKWGKVFYQTEYFGKENKRVNYFIAETKSKSVVLMKNPISGLIEHSEYVWVTEVDLKNYVVPRIFNAFIWSVERIKGLI